MVSIAALIALLIGDHFHDLAGTFYSLAEYAVLPLSLWALVLGVAMYQGHTSLTSGSVGRRERSTRPHRALLRQPHPTVLGVETAR